MDSPKPRVPNLIILSARPQNGGKKRAMATTSAMATAYCAEKKKAGKLTPGSEVQQRRILFGFAVYCPDDPSLIRRADVIRYLGTIRHLAVGTRRFYHSTVHGFTRWLRRRGVLAKSPFREIETPRVPQPVHRALDADQVAALVAACETPRERVLVLLALHTGLRRAELASLEVGDVSLVGRTLTVRCGKGGASRPVPLSAEAVRVIAAYIATEGLSAGPLLRSTVHPERGVSPQTVWRTFDAVAKRSGVKVRPGDGVATHAARHTCATDVHRACGDVLVVQAILGHAHLSTTERYIATLDVDRLRSAVEGRSYLGPAA